MSVKNFVQCGLVTPVAANTTELMLMAPTASYQYPPLDGGTLVIADSVARPSFYEIISYTHRIENVLYGVVRAKEGTTARTWSGVTWIYQPLTAQDYVDALALKAPLASPALTGVPTAPTAPLGTNTQQIATMAAVQAAIANLVASSPAALDTLNELAAALGNDPNFATTMNNALAGKEPSIAAGTSAQMWLGNKTWASVLTQVQNTLLTGLGAGSNATILTTDTMIGALAKIQNQLNNKTNFTDPRLSDAREWTATEVSQAEAEAGTTTIPRKWSALRVWQAVLASSLTGLNLTVGTAVTATDTVLVAIGKLQKQITDAASNFAGSVRATVLTGYVSGSNVALASSDTVLAAFGKVQAQITALATSKLDSNANAVSAAKLATARYINGVAFDGSADITVADNTKLPLAGGTMTGAITLPTNGTSWIDGTSGMSSVRFSAASSAYSWHAWMAQRTAKGNSFAVGQLGEAWYLNWASNADIANSTNQVTNLMVATSTDVTFGVAVHGNGSGLTTLNAENLASGIVPDARLSGTYTGVNITGNAGTANRAGVLNWTIYGGGQGVGNGSHVIFDASNGVSPSGKAVNNTNSEVAWESTFPTLMGWNGTKTFGVRVDCARYAESLTSNITINGVAANVGSNITVADATKLPLAGGTMTGGLATKIPGYSVGFGGGDNSLSVRGDTSSAAVMSFHRVGAYGINLGLDTDNVFRLGGWSNGINVYRFQVDGSGNFTANGNVTAYSDIRLKKDIRVIPDALAKVEQLSGVTYERIDSGERQTGLIAQEVQKVLPEAVSGDDMLSVAYGNLVGLLIEAIKELNHKVDKQAREIAELRAL